MILKVQFSDLDAIYALTKSCGQHLIDKGIFQWNEFYPSKEVLKKDIQLDQLYKFVENDQIIGIVVLTEIEDEEYKRVKWLTKNGGNLYIHRLAVHPNFQGKGIAKHLMDFAENFAEINKYQSVRLDTFSQNKRNQQFYENRNYIKLEEIYFPNQSKFPFYCYELILNEF